MGTAKTVNNGTQPYKLYFIVANIKYSSGCVFLIFFVPDFKLILYSKPRSYERGYFYGSIHIKY